MKVQVNKLTLHSWLSYMLLIEFKIVILSFVWTSSRRGLCGLCDLGQLTQDVLLTVIQLRFPLLQFCDALTSKARI